MMEKVTGKNLLRIRFSTVSPLILGSGKNVNTDNDIVLDSVGKPYIPGTAIAGVTRSMFEDNDMINRYFGYVPDYKQAEMGSQAIASKIIFYDAKIDEKNAGKWYISKRDFVKLDKWKTAVKGAKFDMEILEPMVSFVTYVEQNLTEDEIHDYTDEIAAWWRSGNIRFGAKSMRGFGRIIVDSIEKVKLDFNRDEDVEHWLNQTIYEESFWGRSEQETEIIFDKREIVLRLDLEIVSAVSIREYTTDVTQKIDLVAQPDYKQLSIHGSDNQKDIPVIPGTSWAGAFRSNMRKLIPDLNEEYFGTVNGKKKKSGMLFSESQVRGSKSKIITRNAIDRFTGGTITGALYTEKTEYGGDTDLEIRFYVPDPPSEIVQAFAASVADLHLGILSVGGLTAVGRGLFKVKAINGEAIAKDEGGDKIYDMVMKVIQEEREQDE